MENEEYFVNTKTGELMILYPYDEKYETNNHQEIWNNRDIWRKISKTEYDFFVLVGESYMKFQEELNQD